jgi:hypothetical protein
MHNCNNRLPTIRPHRGIQVQLDLPLHLETSTPARWFTAKTSEFDYGRPWRWTRKELTGIIVANRRYQAAAQDETKSPAGN